MTQIENAAYQWQGKSFSQYKKQLLRIDMTPMVDLGFLLITFFVFTTTISSPMVIDLYMPGDDPVSIPQNLPKSLALTLLLGDNNKIFYYHGDFDQAVKTNSIFETDYSTYSGIGKIIRQKQKDIDDSGKFPNGRRGLMLLIKPTSGSAYKNVIDALDEVMINGVRKYAIVEPVKEEIDYIRSKKS